MTGAVLAALAGSLIMGGIVAVVAGVVGRDVDEFTPRRRRRSSISITRALRLRLVLALAVGLVVAVLTGWVIAILAAPVLALVVPWLIAKPAGADRLAKLEAMEEWVRSLSGVLAAGQGIEATLLASRRTVPPEIEPQVTQLCRRLQARWSTPEALRALADDLDDPVGDLIVSLLLLGSSQRGQGLSHMLHDLAVTVSEEITAYRSIERDMTEASSTARTVSVISLAALVGMGLLSGTYLAAYTSPAGQVVAAGLLTAYLAVLIVLRKMSATPAPPRLLGPKARREVAA